MNGVENRSEPWHIRNPPTAHHVLRTSAAEVSLGRQWQRRRNRKKRKGKTKERKKYTNVVRVAHCIVLFSFQNHSSSYEVHRHVFCLDLGIGPRNDAHVVSGTNCHSVSARTSLTIVFSRPLDALKRHLKIPLDFRTFAFFLTAIRHDEIKFVGISYEFRLWLTALVPFTSHSSWQPTGHP